MDHRKAIEAEVAQAFARGDFAVIESRYARAVATNERTASGVIVSARIVMGLVPGPGSVSGAPKGHDAHWKAVERKVQGWMEQHPQSVLAAIALSQAYKSHGWAFRGGGYANTVLEEDWKKFHDYLGRAAGALASRAEIGRKDPNWRRQVLEVGRTLGWPAEKYFAFAQESLDAFPQFYDTYFEIALSLLPKWGGSLEALAAFADHAAARTKATDGNALYARIYWFVYADVTPQSWAGKDVDWRRIRAGFDDMVKRYPEPWNLNFYARAACDVGDKPTARRLLAVVGDQLVPEAWPNRGAWSRCKNWAAG
jgi:hypothetical protein